MINLEEKHYRLMESEKIKCAKTEEIINLFNASDDREPESMN